MGRSGRRGLPAFAQVQPDYWFISIAGNLLLMRLLVGLGHINYVLANGITITAFSVINFLVSDGFVFAADGTETQSM